MWTRRISSGNVAQPTPKDLYRYLISNVIEKDGRDSWSHFEVISERGWFINLLYGKQPWIEIALIDQKSLALSPGIPKAQKSLMPDIPLKWRNDEKRKWIGIHHEWVVPVAELEELIDWIDKCLSSVSGRSDYRVSGWIEGL